MSDSAYPPAGSLLLVHGAGPVSWAIRALTHSAFSHAAIFGPDGEIIEAAPPSVRVNHVSAYFGQRAEVLTTGTERQLKVIYETARGMVGRPYADLEIVDLGAEAVGLPWRRLNQFLEGHDHGTICSAMTAQCAAAAGIDWRCGRPSFSAVRPSDLARLDGLRPYTVPTTPVPPSFRRGGLNPSR